MPSSHPEKFSSLGPRPPDDPSAWTRPQKAASKRPRSFETAHPKTSPPSTRKLLGWDRYDSPEALAALNDLYRNELRLMMNLFQPTVKLAAKKRVGSRLRRTYAPAQTPLDRLAAHPEADPQRVQALLQRRQSLDPFELSKVIDRKLKAIYALANSRLSPQSAMTQVA